jgi:hypothetical protein
MGVAMKPLLLPLLGVLLLTAAAPARAHRLDEYLQAAILSVDHGEVEVALHLAPGVAVAPAVVARMDADGDGFISEAEERAYVDCVARDVSLEVDGRRLSLRPVSWRFPSPASMKEGATYVQVSLVASLPGGANERSLVFENHHEAAIATYMANVLQPTDKALTIEHQHRTPDQSRFQVDFLDAHVPAERRWMLWEALAVPVVLSAAMFAIMQALAGRYRVPL